jgi:serine/threonine protein kinase
MNQELFLIFESMQANLYELLTKQFGRPGGGPGFEEDMIKQILYQILLGLDFLH